MRDRARTLLLAAAGAALIAGCGSSGDRPAPASSPADARFVAHMLPHHRRAILVGRLAQQRGTDPRVRAFGARIVREQSPEAARLTGWRGTLDVDVGPQDGPQADGFIADPVLSRLRREAGRRFDRDVLLASASSEQGAARMAQAELKGGRYAPARRLAASIATAPGKEIPQLRALVAALPRP